MTSEVKNESEAVIVWDQEQYKKIAHETGDALVDRISEIAPIILRGGTDKLLPGVSMFKFPKWISASDLLKVASDAVGVSCEKVKGSAKKSLHYASDKAIGSTATIAGWVASWFRK